MPTVSADNLYHIDHSIDPTFAPGNFLSFKPEELSFNDSIGSGTLDGVGDCSYAISFSSKDEDNNLIVSGHDFIGPYRSYFRLRYGNVVIMAGPIVSHHTGLGDDYMTVAGKTWEHMLSKWQYPFDPRGDVIIPTDPVNSNRYPNTFIGNEVVGSGVSTPTGLAYQASNRDLILILSDILSQTMNAGNRIIFDISLLAGTSGIATNFQFSLGDTSYMDSVIQGLAGTGNGFNWWISHDMKFFWASPYRFGNTGAPSIVLVVDGSTDEKTPDSLAFTNNGPVATHVFGQGAGLASQTTLGRAYGYTPAQVQFSRLDASYDFGDIRNVNQIINKTQKQLSHDLQPQHDIPLSVDPARISSFWSNWRKGRAIFIDYELTSHRIDSPQQLISYSATMDSGGQVAVDFTLDQIYDLAVNAGSPEG
jgi:hypothetical protein